MLAGVALWGYYGFLVLHDVVIDDAYIVLRHARNFAAGYGLNYNPGERVEGYTSFLYVILQSLPYFLQDDPILFTKILGLISLSGFLATSFMLARRILTPWMAPLVPLALAVSINVASMSVWGLETVTYSALLTAGVAAAVYQRPALSGLIMAIAALTRMEAALPALIIGIAFTVPLWRILTSESPRNLWLKIFVQSSAFSYGLSFGLIFVPYFLIRAHYYGAWMPNTYTSKVGTLAQMAPRGLRFILDMYSRNGFPALILIMAGGTWMLMRERTPPARRPLCLLFAIIVGYHLYILRVGGDYYPTFHDRFFVHFYGIYYVFLFWCVEAMLNAFANRIEDFHHPRVLTTFGGWGLVVMLGILHAINPPVIEYTSITGWKTLGLYLRDNSPPGASLAVDAAGAIPYFSELPTIDILGKADRHIGTKIMPTMGQGIAAHEKGDPAYVLRRAPTWITTWITPYGQAQRHFMAYYDFRTHYQLAALVNMTRNDVDASRIRFITDTDLDHNVLRQLPRDGEAWGLFQRLDPPLDEVVLNSVDLATTINPWWVTLRLPGKHDGTSDLATIQPQASGLVLSSLPLHYTPGSYVLAVRYTCDVEDDPAMAMDLGHIDVQVQDQVIATHPLTCIDRSVDVPFIVPANGLDNAGFFQWYALGGHKIHLIRVSIKPTPTDG